MSRATSIIFLFKYKLFICLWNSAAFNDFTAFSTHKITSGNSSVYKISSSAISKIIRPALNNAVFPLIKKWSQITYDIFSSN